MPPGARPAWGQRVPGALVQEGLRHPHIQVTLHGYSALPEVLPVFVISRSILGDIWMKNMCIVSSYLYFYTH